MATLSFKSQVHTIQEKKQAAFAQVRELERTLSVERARIAKLEGEVDAERHVRQ